MSHLQPTQSAAISVLQKAQNKGFVMLNLIRLKASPEYSTTCLNRYEHATDANQTFNTYVEQTEPFLAASGGELLLNANAGDYFVGSENESWDKVMLIKQNFVTDFFLCAKSRLP